MYQKKKGGGGITNCVCGKKKNRASTPQLARVAIVLESTHHVTSSSISSLPSSLRSAYTRQLPKKCFSAESLGRERITRVAGAKHLARDNFTEMKKRGLFYAGKKKKKRT